MGQIAIVLGPEPAAADVHRRLDGAMRRSLGLEPADRRSSPGVGATRFPSLRAPGPGFVAGPGGAWIAGIGTWFLDGSDAEDDLARLLRDLLDRDGPRAATLDRLDGSFAIVAWLPERGEVVAVTDRIGTVHLYRADVDGCAVLCSSSLALQTVRRARWDADGVRDFLETGTVFGGGTLFDGVAKVGPATVLRVGRDGDRGATTYWGFEGVAWDRAATPGTPERLGDALEGALRTVVGRFRAPVLDLTGGYDSRAVLAAMTRVGYPFATVVNGPAGHPDVAVANRIAVRFGLDHRHRPPEPERVERWWDAALRALPLCDGEYDVLEYAGTMENHLALAGEFDVSVNGSGGEFCKGYWWELLGRAVGDETPLDAARVARARFATEGWTGDVLAMRFAEDHAARLAAVIDDEIAALRDYPNTAQLDRVYLALRMQRWQGRIASATSRIWPCVSPFLFREALEQAISAPPPVRRRNRMSARLIDHLHPALASMPLAQGYPAQPLRLSNAHRFVPALADLGRRAWGKALRTLARRPYTGDVRTDGADRLMARPEARDCLTPRSMATAELYDRASFDRWVAAAMRRPTPEAFRRLGRVVTLELLARAARSGSAP